MSAAELCAAVLAMATVNRELADDGLARNLGLKLLIAMIFDDVAAALRTLVGQRGVEPLADVGGGRRRTMTMLAMLPALLAAAQRLLFADALADVFDHACFSSDVRARENAPAVNR